MLMGNLNSFLRRYVMSLANTQAVTKRGSVAANPAPKLVMGSYYLFDPPIKAVGIPTGGPDTCKIEECTFNRGWYIGLERGKQVFSGKPINDHRTVRKPKGWPHSKGLLEQLRECRFHILLTSRTKVIVDTNQKN